MKKITKIEGQVFLIPKLKTRRQEIEDWVYELTMVVIFTFIISALLLLVMYEVRFIDVLFISCLVSLFRK